MSPMPMSALLMLYRSFLHDYPALFTLITMRTLRIFLPLFLLVIAGCQPSTQEVVLHTSQGDITVALYPASAPKTVENFVTHAENGYYDGLIFHRVIPDFMIQGGDPTGTGAGGESIWGEPFADEINDEPMERGAVAMANRGPNTNGSQFFIVQREEGASWLEGMHTVFGKVTSGMEVVDAIANVPRDANDKPLDDVTFTVEVR